MADDPVDGQASPQERPSPSSAALEPEPEAPGLEVDDIDHDSAFEEELEGSTASIGSSVMKYREENGRTYHVRI